MKIAFFSAKPYDKLFFDQHNQNYGFELQYFETHMGPHIVNVIDKNTAVICAFVNDKLDATIIEALAQKGVKIIAMRCAGFNNVDLTAATKYGIRVCRVPAYSPEAVAEHAMAMLLTLVRKTHKAYNRVREQNFALNGLLGFNLHGKTVGVVGTGKIGKAFCKIALGFGCKVIAYDLYPDQQLSNMGVNYVALDDLLAQAKVISLHCPLTTENTHLINAYNLRKMQPGVTIINTSRGGLINTTDAIEFLKNGHISNLGLDVYEQEGKLFFKDLSGSIIDDDTIQRLMSFPNVLITGHQAFFTEEALAQIAEVTLENIDHLNKENLPADGNRILV